jgi:hypothetical protein
MARQKGIDLEAAKAIGERFKVPVFFAGSVLISGYQEITNTKPDSGQTAEIKISLAIQLFSTETGQAIWGRIASEKAMFGPAGLPIETVKKGRTQIPSFPAPNPDEAYGELLKKLVRKLTHDFR